MPRERNTISELILRKSYETLRPKRRALGRQTEGSERREPLSVEDTRHAVQDARRRGRSVFRVAIDKPDARQPPPAVGPAGFSLVSQPEKLASALPRI
ncbi:hypothetical protein GJ654_04440 [Rhodoblastus acidophilus]|uniref:Uncharacterized protein n=1 Tax=Rhodoblastus acidophilus TaxID=1074 RepID=A0A6N8DIY0_RHOAC|nr:hypothetical protein [Rhodoblastus acidophilus]MCW2273681.1 hypothetical protein [Rhodoblastus acidophilus]MTV30238.1 hypothetical protein [Rhodoblastus acidophilus]